jgi:predicted alpha/beta-hydrolase family hydrolase
MDDARQRIEVEAGIGVSAAWTRSGTSPSSDCLVLGHGAGSSMEHPFLRFFAERMAAGGIDCLRFNFPYVEAGRKTPDRSERLQLTWRSVLAYVRRETKPRRLFAGGRSMGGRIATLVAAEGEALSGLVLLAYPLQPAGRPEVLRKEHFPRLRCPLLFVQGSRDPLCELPLLREALTSIPAAVTLHVVAEGDHGFKLPRASGRTEREVWDEVAAATLEWMRSI